MKIAFVVHDYRRREGHSRYVVELATRFARNHEVHVFASEIDDEGDSRIRFHRVPIWRSSALTSILSFFFVASLRVWGKYDIVHNQGLCGVRGNVFTAHICNRAWGDALREVSGGLSFREWVSGTVLGALERLFYRSARNCVIIAVSERVARDLRRCYQCRAPIRVIYHGVDLSAFNPDRRDSARAAVRQESGLAEKDPVFLFVGDMRKGGRQCIRALSQLPSGKLLFISRSPDGPFRQLAAELGLAERVKFLGVKQQVERYYAAADALLLPTHYDTFAMVVTEAMASGLPVLVSREAGASELIRHGVNGLLLEDFRDHMELAEKMLRLAADPGLRLRLGVAARETAERHSWDTVAAETMRAYENLLAGVRRLPSQSLPLPESAPSDSSGVKS